MQESNQLGKGDRTFGDWNRVRPQSEITSPSYTSPSPGSPGFMAALNALLTQGIPGGLLPRVKNPAPYYEPPEIVAAVEPINRPLTATVTPSPSQQSALRSAVSDVRPGWNEGTYYNHKGDYTAPSFSQRGFNYTFSGGRPDGHGGGSGGGNWSGASIGTSSLSESGGGHSAGKSGNNAWK